MFLKIPILIICGCILGVITGLTPGIHINLVSAMIVIFSEKLLKYLEIQDLIVLIVSMSITHLFLDIIPSLFLGVPSPDNVSTILPSHKLLLEGKAKEAIILTLIGTIFSIIFVILFSPLIIIALPTIQTFLKEHIHIILILLSLFLILKEKNKLQTFIIFSLSGILGILTLNLPNLNEPLLPLLSGLFGLSSLILSIKNNTKIPTQDFKNKINCNLKINLILLGLLSGIISAFLPGLGSSQVSVLISSAIKKIESKDYLILNSSINTTNMIVSFLTLYSIKKSRNGIVVSVSELIPNFNLNYLILTISIILITLPIATFLTIIFSKLFSKLIIKINYKKICILIILIITILVFLISKYVGLIILITSTSLGIYAQLKDVNKNHLMACLLLPVILYFII